MKCFTLNMEAARSSEAQYPITALETATYFFITVEPSNFTHAMLSGVLKDFFLQTITCLLLTTESVYSNFFIINL
jgi:hypothetical protein